jgi:hypothetical protein
MADVKILHNYVFDEIKDGKLNLYFPHNSDIKINPDIIKNLSWSEACGFKSKVINEKRTDIIYPYSFDISSCFEQRDSFEYASNMNKHKKKKLSKNDFLILVYSKFLKSSKICNNTFSLVYDFSEKDASTSELRYFKKFSKIFENSSDELMFTKDLNSVVEIDDYVKAKLLKGNVDNKMIVINVAEDFSSHDKSKPIDKYDSKIRNINLPNLKIKGVKSDYFQEIISVLDDFFGFVNHKVYYNIMSGLIFSNDLRSSDIELDLSKKSNLIDSGGLFITETYTKLVEIDIFKEKKDVFNSNVLDYHKSKASWYFNPNILYKSLITHCQNINKILENKNHDLHNDDNVRTFLSGMMEDLSLGMKSLGMFLVDEIDCTIKNI